MNFSQLFALGFRHKYDFNSNLRHIYPSEFTIYFLTSSLCLQASSLRVKNMQNESLFGYICSLPQASHRQFI